MIDIRQTDQYAGYLKNIGWIIEKKNGVYYFIKKIPILGAVIKVQRPKSIDFGFIEILAKKYRAFQIILEPDLTSFINPKIILHVQKKSESSGSCIGSAKKFVVKTKLDDDIHKLILIHGYKLTKSSYLPTKTTTINLIHSEETMLETMHPKTRYNIKKAKKIGLIVQNSSDTKPFADFWQNCASKQRGMYISQKKEIIALSEAFKGKQNILFVIQSANKYQPLVTKNILAAVFNIYTKDRAYYMYAAATKEGKKLFAPTLAAWESIRLAKKKGLLIYDFEGIFDERFPLPSWKGFSRFKLSFGGDIIKLPGSYIRLRIPL